MDRKTKWCGHNLNFIKSLNIQYQKSGKQAFDSSKIKFPIKSALKACQVRSNFS
jgi:hypothetical protein